MEMLWPKNSFLTSEKLILHFNQTIDMQIETRTNELK